MNESTIPYTNPLCSLSWNGHNVYGDEASIREVSALVEVAHEWKTYLEKVKATRALISS